MRLDIWYIFNVNENTYSDYVNNVVKLFWVIQLFQDLGQNRDQLR